MNCPEEMVDQMPLSFSGMRRLTSAAIRPGRALMCRSGLLGGQRAHPLQRAAKLGTDGLGEGLGVEPKRYMPLVPDH